jgi:hypothetical protein
MGARTERAAQPAPAASASPDTAAGSSRLQFAPRAREMSNYVLQAIYEIKTTNVTFDAPPAYRDSFTFWTSRYIGQRQREVYEFMTLTQEAREDGTVPFRRTIPRFDLELEREGKHFAPLGPIFNKVKALAWVGSLDRFGNVKEMDPVATTDDPEVAQLSIQQLERIFPVVEGAMEIRQGAGFKERFSMPIPTRLNIVGLEDIRLQISRDFRLSRMDDNSATFEVRTEYAIDPATPPKEPRTTCAISGGGTGQMVFDRRRGVFLSSSLPGALVIEIQAPLRRLPDQPENEDPGMAKTRLDLQLSISGTQTVRRVWGEDKD